MNVYDVIRKPIITEKGHAKRESERTMCFEVHRDAKRLRSGKLWKRFSESKWRKSEPETSRGSCGGAAASPATHRIGKRRMCACSRGKKCPNTRIFREGSRTSCPLRVFDQ